MSWDVCSLNEGITGVNWLHISIQSWRGPLHLCIAFCLAHNDGRCFLKIQGKQLETWAGLNMGVGILYVKLY